MRHDMDTYTSSSASVTGFGIRGMLGEFLGSD